MNYRDKQTNENMYDCTGIKLIWNLGTEIVSVFKIHEKLDEAGLITINSTPMQD